MNLTAKIFQRDSNRKASDMTRRHTTTVWATVALFAVCMAFSGCGETAGPTEVSNNPVSPGAAATAKNETDDAVGYVQSDSSKAIGGREVTQESAPKTELEKQLWED